MRDVTWAEAIESARMTLQRIENERREANRREAGISPSTCVPEKIFCPECGNYICRYSKSGFFILNHRRKDGVWELLRQCIDKLLERRT